MKTISELKRDIKKLNDEQNSGYTVVYDGEPIPCGIDSRRCIVLSKEDRDLL